MHVWDEISLGRQRRDTAGFSRSSFQHLGMCKNEKEMARRQRETYLREVAIEVMGPFRSLATIGVLYSLSMASVSAVYGERTGVLKTHHLNPYLSESTDLLFFLWLVDCTVSGRR
jgi:hypothetical protein